jgi:hypothetical protein
MNPEPRSYKKYLLPIVSLAAIIALALAVYFYFEARSAKNPERAMEREVSQLVQEVGKVIVLPQEESPTVATVSDLEPLKGQPFFMNAKVGDKVLIYTNARKAILWRPSDQKLVEVSPLNLDAQSISQ